MPRIPRDEERATGWFSEELRDDPVFLVERELKVQSLQVVEAGHVGQLDALVHHVGEHTGDRLLLPSCHTNQVVDLSP